MTGRIKVSARATATDGRTGLLTNPEHGVEIPGIDLEGITFLAGIRITNLSTGTATTLNLATLDVTENGATSADEGGDWRGRDITAADVRFLAIVPDSANAGFVNFTSGIFSGSAQPSGMALIALPNGLGGSSLATPLSFSPSEASQGVRVYIWGAAA